MKINKNKYYRDFSVLVSVICVGTFFSFMAPNYLTGYTISAVFRQASELGILAMVMTMLIIGGEFDLSVGSIYAVVGISIGILHKNGVMLPVAMVLGLAIGAFMGLINGVLVIKTGINSFIGTLATQKMFRGIALVLTAGQSVSGFPDNIFFDIFGRGKLFNVIPVPIIWFLFSAVVFYFCLHKTSFGYKIYAIGDNRQAAHLAGIDVKRQKLYSFILSGFTAGFISIISLSYLKTATPSQGSGLELEAIAAAVIGGTAMSGGVGSITGTILGVLIIAQVRTGLVLMGTNAYIQDALVGLLIAVSVIINAYIVRKNNT